MSTPPPLMRAFLLHARPYRETSALLELITAEAGRVALVARGARAPKSALRGVLQPFQPLLLSWAGRGELGTLRSAETLGLTRVGGGEALLCGFYLNELLVRLLPRQDPNPELFALYEASLTRLGQGEPPEPVLRGFELELLDALGYGLDLSQDEAGAPLSPLQHYRYLPQRGFVLGEPQAGTWATLFPGAQLLAIAQRDFAEPGVRASAKHLLRLALQALLGHKPLRSRELFLKRD